MKIACAKGCGQTLEVSMAALEEMASLGDVVVQHEKCPTDEDLPQNIYKIVTEVFEVHPQKNMDDDVHEKLASMGDIVHGTSFTDAVERLGIALNSQWSRIVGMAPTIDLPRDDEPSDDEHYDAITEMHAGDGYGHCKGCGSQEPIEVLDQLEGYHSSECAREHEE